MPIGTGELPQNRLANFVNVAARRQIHHRVGAVVHGRVQLFQLFFNFGGDRRVADVGVDLAQRGHADRHRLQFRMVDIGGNNHPPARYFVAHQFRRDLFAMRNVAHFFGDHTLTRVVHLREIAVGVGASCARASHSARGLGAL